MFTKIGNLKVKTKFFILAVLFQLIMVGSAVVFYTMMATAEQLATINYPMIGVQLVVMGLVGSLMFAMSRHVVKPVCLMTEALKKITEGDFNVTVSVDRQDEFGHMASALNGTVKNLKTKVENLVFVISAAANGDLTKTCKVSGEDPLGQVGSSLSLMISKLKNSFSTLNDNISTTVLASTRLSKVSDKVSDNSTSTLSQASVVAAAAEQMSHNAHTVASAMEEMGASIREIAKNSAEAATVVGNAVKIAQVASATMTKLGESSAEIGKVVKVITSIAEQTNLLALNATIEAARAGEAGKGFAVVANEVKDLAKETAKATEEISVKITSIQNDTQSAVGAIAQISEIINSINNIQSTIASAVEEQTVTTNEIARNISEVAKGSSEVAGSIVQVTEAAQSASQGAEEGRNVSVELQDMSQILQNLAGQYTCNEAGNGGEICWQPSYAIGNAEIDSQHKELFGRLGSFFSALKNNDAEQIGNSVNFLEDYVNEHFGYEQQTMQRLSYPEYQAHLAMHTYYIGKLSEVKTELKKGVTSGLIVMAKRHLIDWLLNHIRTVDVKLGLFINKSQGEAKTIGQDMVA